MFQQVEQDSVNVANGSGIPGIFVGTYRHSLDSKKRITIPSDWRELVGVPERLFILPGIKEHCLCAYPAREMTHRMEKFRKLSIADKKGRQLARALGSRSDWAPWDGQGRIRIKDELLQYAGLDRQTVLVGSIDHLELWSPDRWDETEGEVTESTIEEAAHYVGF